LYLPGRGALGRWGAGCSVLTLPRSSAFSFRRVKGKVCFNSVFTPLPSPVHARGGEEEHKYHPRQPAQTPFLCIIFITMQGEGRSGRESSSLQLTLSLLTDSFLFSRNSDWHFIGSSEQVQNFSSNEPMTPIIFLIFKLNGKVGGRLDENGQGITNFLKKKAELDFESLLSEN